MMVVSASVSGSNSRRTYHRLPSVIFSCPQGYILTVLSAHLSTCSPFHITRSLIPFLTQCALVTKRFFCTAQWALSVFGPRQGQGLSREWGYAKHVQKLLTAGALLRPSQSPTSLSEFCNGGQKSCGCLQTRGIRSSMEGPSH